MKKNLKLLGKSFVKLIVIGLITYILSLFLVMIFVIPEGTKIIFKDLLIQAYHFAIDFLTIILLTIISFIVIKKVMDW